MSDHDDEICCPLARDLDDHLGGPSIGDQPLDAIATCNQAFGEFTEIRGRIIASDVCFDAAGTSPGAMGG